MLTLIVLLVAQHPANPARPPADSGLSFQVGKAELTLAGPWRFKVGDDPTWGSPTYDDQGWETISLAAPPGAHDGDVGLSGFVPGWGTRGHPGYSGFAWYRIRVRISGGADSLAIAGPPYVEDAYQLFVNGQLLGGVGNFRDPVPSAFSTTPLLRTMPPTSVAVIALRVWMASEDALAAPDGGGVHIAPALGTVPAMTARVRVEWMELIRGYFLEMLQAAAFVALAFGVLGLRQLDARPAYSWIAAGLLATAVMRALLAVTAWTAWISLRQLDLLENAGVIPVMIGAWCLAWWSVAGRRPHWLWKPIVAATGMQMVGRVLANGAILGGSVPATHILNATIEIARLVLALAYVVPITWLVRERGSQWALIALTALLVGTGLFASELSTVGIPGIWFPYGTGVSRTQFAYAAANVTIALWLWSRLRELHGRTGAPSVRPQHTGLT